jgi:hypothetical protein
MRRSSNTERGHKNTIARFEGFMKNCTLDIQKEPLKILGSFVEIMSYQRMLSSKYSWCDCKYWNTRDVPYDENCWNTYSSYLKTTFLILNAVG